MSNERKTQSGMYERTSVEEAIHNRDAAWQDIRKAEEAYAFEKRKRRVLMAAGLILTTAAMIAFIEYGQISFYLAMCFNAALSGVFGYHVK